MHYTPHRALKSSKRYYNRYVLKLGFIGQKTLVHKFTQIFDQLSAGDLFITFSCQRGVESRELGQLIRGAWQHAMHMCILYIMQTCHAFFINTYPLTQKFLSISAYIQFACSLLKKDQYSGYKNWKVFGS